MDIYKYLIDDVVAPPKVEPIVKREDAEGLMSMRNRQAAAAKVVPDVKSSAVGTIARLYNKIIQEQIKDAKGNVVFDKGMAYSPVSYSANSDGIQDITSAGHDFDRVLRDSLRAGSLVSSTPRRDVKSEILTKIERELSNDIGERQKTLSPLVSLALGNVTKADRDFRRYIDIKQGQGYGVEAFGSGNVFTNDEDKKEFAAADNLTESLERALDLQKEASSGVEVGDAKDSNVTQSVQGLGARPEVEDDPTVEGAVSEELQRSQERGGSQDNVDAVEAYLEEVKQAQTVLTDTQETAFGQKALQELGFYANKIDGDAGPQTSSAIKTFQYKNNLPVTGVLDEDTKIKLSSTSGLVSQPKPQTTLLSFISKGEGGYGAVNNDNSAGNVPKANQKFMIDGYYSDTYNKPLTDMTVNEIMNAQVGTTGKTTEELLKMNPASVASQKKREFFAVGAYQIVPVTMWTAARQGAIDANDIFSSKVQDKIAMDFLAGSDRPKLRDFLAGDPNVSVDEAALDLAKQFASAPVTQTQSVAIKIKKKDGSFGTGTKNVVAGTSYYDKVGNNSAQHTAAETKAMLLQARDENTL